MTLVTVVSQVAGLLYFMAPAYAANMAPPFGYRLGIRDVKW